MSRTLLRLSITALSLAFIVGGTFLAIQFGRGYRLSRDGNLSGTGLLAANSYPAGALIVIDGQAYSKVTDDTINLSPGVYQIKIEKEGYTSWQKNLSVEAGVVAQSNAELFRTVPSLAPLSFSGATNINPSPDGQKIAFVNASPSGTLKAGLFVLELSDNPLSLSKSPRQVSQNPIGLDFKNASLLWSPDSSQILASFRSANYLIDTGTLTKTADLKESSAGLSLLLASWEEELTKRDRQLLLTLPEEMLQIATASAKNVYFSPNGEKILYTATFAVTIPDRLTTAPPGSSTQRQERTLKPGSIYVYDLKEDKNFVIYDHPDELGDDPFTKINLIDNFAATSGTTATVSAKSKLQDPSNLQTTIANFRGQYSPQSFTAYQWFPTSNHILINRNGSIDIIEYDGGNLVTLYAGAYEDNFVYPWPNGSKLIILTNITSGPNLPANLYAINLK